MGDTIFKIDVDPCRCPETNAPLVTFKLKYLDAINESMSESEVTCTVNRVEDNEVNVNLTNKKKAMATRNSWNTQQYSAKSKAMSHQLQRCNEDYEQSYNTYRTSRKSAMAHSMKRSANVKKSQR